MRVTSRVSVVHPTTQIPENASKPFSELQHLDGSGAIRRESAAPIGRVPFPLNTVTKSRDRKFGTPFSPTTIFRTIHINHTLETSISLTAHMLL